MSARARYQPWFRTREPLPPYEIQYKAKNGTWHSVDDRFEIIDARDPRCTLAWRPPT